jgi:hypothetical protein
MITDRTATVIVGVTTGLWLLSILYGIFGYDQTESFNGLFMVIVGAAFALRSSRIRPQETDEEYVVKYLERTKFMNWLIQKFLPSVWDAEVQMDIAWYDHKDDTAHHVVIGPEECPFCIKEAAKKRSKDAVSEPSNMTPLLMPAGLISETTSGYSLQIGDHTTITAGGISKAPSGHENEFEARKRDMMIKAEQAYLRDYIESVPFMRLEEGEEIIEKNMSGEVVRAFRCEDSVICDLCEKTYLHEHEDIKVVRPEDGVECQICTQPGIHVHMDGSTKVYGAKRPTPLKVDVPEYDMVH